MRSPVRRTALKTFAFSGMFFTLFQVAAQSTVATPYDEAMLLIESVKYQ